MGNKVISNVRIIQKCFVVNKKGLILALKRAPDDRSRGGNWDLPGGGYEEGENIIEAIKREVKEEAGLTVNELRPIYVTNHQNVKAGFFEGNNVFGICYISGDWSGEVTLSSEHTEYRWITLADFATLSFGQNNGFFTEAVKYLEI